MKTSFIARSLFLVIGSVCISGLSFSQQAKMTGQEKKEAKKAKQIENYNRVNMMLDTRNFVLKADYLENRYGDRAQVSPVTNFILVSSANGVLQTSFNNAVGYNGVGGVTAEGTIGSWEVEKNSKKMTFTVRFSLLTNIGIYDIFMTVNSDYRAYARISGLTRGDIRYSGHLGTGDGNQVFKGRNSL
jgi:hypothetical protein